MGIQRSFEDNPTLESPLETFQFGKFPIVVAIACLLDFFRLGILRVLLAPHLGPRPHSYLHSRAILDHRPFLVNPQPLLA